MARKWWLPRWGGWVLQWLDVNSCDTICVLGKLPDRWDVQLVLRRLHGAIWAHEYTRLETAQSFSKRRIGVLYVGVGEEGRGLVLRSARRDGGKYLTSEWWHGLNREVSLVAYSCHSAPLLRESRTLAHLAHAVAYSDAIWLTTDSGEYWTDLLAKMLDALRSEDGGANELYATLQELYIQAIRDSRSSLTYLGKACLVQQSQTMELIHGS
jgi:hypothetical protein